MKLIISSILLFVCVYTHVQSKTSEQEGNKVSYLFSENVKRLDGQLQSPAKGKISDVSYSNSFSDVYEKEVNGEYVLKGSKTNKIKIITSIVTFILGFGFIIIIWYIGKRENKSPSDKKALFRKFLFFWVVFNSIGYFSFLADIHPSIEVKYGKNAVYTNYLLTPDCTKYEEQEHFYPFHDYFNSGYIGTSVFGSFVGIYGYYGHYEFLLYVVVPLLCIFLVWFYRKYVK